MKRRGLVRLWVAVTAIFVPAVAYWRVDDLIRTWRHLDDGSIQLCVNQEGTPNFNVDKCIHDFGAYQTAFQHEHTTAGAVWTEALGIALALDIFITVLLIAMFLVVRWVVRGFKEET